MVTLLLTIIYLAFVGLGLPDALLGSAWPIIKLEIGATTEMAGYISLTVSFFTVISSLNASRLLHRFGTGKVTLFSILFTTLAVLGFSMSNAFLYLILLAIPLGLGAGAVDASLNNYLALYFKAKHMNWLHCFWGIGAVAGPVVMSYWLTNNENWRAGYVTVGLILLAIVMILLFTLSLWKIFEKDKLVNQEEQKLIRNSEALQVRGVKTSMLAMLCYNGSETAAGLWMASYFIANREMSAGIAAASTSLFFIGIITGRILAGFLSTKISSQNLIRYGGLVGCIGLILLILPVPHWIVVGALFVTGFGGAPIYPSIIHVTPSRFGDKASSTIIGLQMASAYTGSTLIPLIIGLFSSWFGLFLVPIMLLILFIIMFISTEMTNRTSLINQIH